MTKLTRSNKAKKRPLVYRFFIWLLLIIQYAQILSPVVYAIDEATVSAQPDPQPPSSTTSAEPDVATSSGEINETATPSATFTSDERGSSPQASSAAELAIDLVPSPTATPTSLPSPTPATSDLSGRGPTPTPSPSILGSMIDPESKLTVLPPLLNPFVINLIYPFDSNFPISYNFGEKSDSLFVNRMQSLFGVTGHDGVDWQMPEGSPIYAADSGRVIHAGRGDYGLTVIIEHSWGKSYYGHLSQISVSKDDKVKQGDALGFSGNTGVTTAPHLHLGIIPNNPNIGNGYHGFIDPLPYLSHTFTPVSNKRELRKYQKLIKTSKFRFVKNTLGMGDNRLSLKFNYPQRSDLNLSLTNPSGVSSDLTDSVFGSAIGPLGPSLTVPLSDDLLSKPGKYSLTVTDSKGLYDVQEFTWGVLAINLNKSLYSPAEQANITIAVLDDSGEMICDADVNLVITDPLGVTTNLSTNDQSILINTSICESKAFTLTPDYQTSYTPLSTGTYQLKLTATTTNGTHSITEQFEVKDEIPFQVERTSATRLYPYYTYPMTIAVTPKENYQGTVTEKVSGAIEIASQDGLTINRIGNEQELKWEVDWQAGQKYELDYQYDVPDVSPAYYELGEFSIGDQFVENRKWQLAIDSITIYPVTTSTTGSGTNQSSFSHTVTSGPNRLLVVMISSEDTTDADRVVSSVTWNTSESLTAAQNQQNDTDNVGASIYYLINPTATTANVVVNFAGAVTSIGVTVVNLYNAAQSSVLDNNTGSNQSNTTSPNLNLTTNTDYAFVTSVVTNNANTALTSTQFERSDFTLPTTAARMVTSTIQKDAAGTQNMGYTAGGATNDYAQAVASFKTIASSIHIIGAITTSTAGSGTNTSTTSYTVPSTGSNRLLVVMVSTEDTTDADRVISSITWNTTENLTAGKNQQNDTSNVGANIYYLANPTAATANVVVTFAGTVTSIGVTIMTLNNVNQSSPIDTSDGSNQDNTATPNLSITTNYSNSFVVSVDTNNANTALTSTQDERSDFTLPTTAARMVASTTVDGDPGTQNMGYTAGGATNDHAQAVVAFRLYITATVTLSGKIYTDEGSSYLDCTSGRTVNLRVDGAGAYSTSCSNSPTNGSWSIGSVNLYSGAVVTVYLDEAAEDATTVYLTDLTAQTNVNLYQNTVIVRADEGTINPDNLYLADDGNNDVRYSVSAASNGNLTVESGFELHIWTGDSFNSSGGTVTTQGSANIHLDDGATLTLDSSGNTIAGDLVVDDTATANLNNSTTINGGDITVSSGGDVASTAGTVTMGASGTIGGGSTGSVFQLTNLTVSSGTTTLGADADNSLDFTGDISISAGATLAMNDKTANVDGGNVTTVSTGAITCASCTAGGITISGDGTTNGIGGGSGGITIYDLTLDGSTNTTTIGTATITILDDITIGANRTLAAYSSGTINIADDWSNSGTFTANSSTVAWNGPDSSTQALTGNTTFANFTVSTSSNSAGRTIQFAGSSTTTVTGTWTITGYSGKVITLQSSDTNAWTINPTAATVTYASISRSTNTGVTFCATYSTDGNNNTNWSISSATMCPSAAAYSFQRKTWYDGTRYWRSYNDSANARIIFEYSTTGSSWTENTSARISTNTNDYSIEADSTNIFIVYTASNDIKGRAGSSYPGTSFSWGSEQVVLNGTSSTDDYSYPTLARDSSSYVFVAARYTGSSVYYMKVVKEAGGTNDLPEDSADTVNSLANVKNSNSNVYGVIAPLSSQNMYISFSMGTTLAGCKWVNSSTAWQDSSGNLCSDNAGTLYNGLVGYWKMEEASDATRVDSSGYSNDLTESTGDTIVQSTGKFGYGATFSAADTEYLSIADQTEFDVGTSFTLSAWVNHASNSLFQQILGYMETNGDWSYNMFLGDQGLVGSYIDNNSGFAAGPGANSANGMVSLSTWTLVSVTYDHNTLRLYKNGTEQTSLDFPLSTTNTPINSTGNFIVGAQLTQSDYFDGIMDDVRIYNRPLSSTEMSALNNYVANGGNYDTIDTTFANTNDTFSAVGDGSGNVYLTFVDDEATDQISSRKYNGTSWGAATLVADAADANDSYTTLSYDSTGSNLYSFWIDTSSNYIYYSTCAVSTNCDAASEWNAEVAWKTTGTNKYISSNVSNAGYIFAQWHDGSAIAWDKVIPTSGNTAPNNPSSLAQKTTGDVTISTGGWHNTTSIKFTAQASDPDASDTLYLCVEKDILGTSFSNTEDSCGTGVAYSGSAVATSITISSQTDASQYHWQARIKDTAGAYSSWVSYDVNAESASDYGLDTTAPTGGTVYDGTGVGVDSTYNTGALDTLSANWASFDSNVSGLNKYQYSIGTTVGGTDIKAWTDNSTTTSVTATSLTLNSSTLYYVNVRAVDNAGNTGSAVSSNGQMVAPSISFSVSPATVTFANLNSGNSYTDTKTTTLTTSTNAYNGYVIRAFVTDYLRSSTGSFTIPDFNGGSYASPGTWVGSETGFGYTSNDTTIGGANKFGTGTLYAPFSQTKPGDIVADHTTTVSGTPINNEAFTITYKVKAPTLQEAKNYSTTVVYTATAQY